MIGRVIFCEKSASYLREVLEGVEHLEAVYLIDPDGMASRHESSTAVATLLRSLVHGGAIPVADEEALARRLREGR